MGYIGSKPTNKPLTSADIEDGVISAADLGANSVDSSELVDGSIDTSHIGATQVTGAKLNNDVISAQTALGATPADTDELLVSDAGVLKRVDYSYLKGITAANFRPNAKPFIINGDMKVAQRGTSLTGQTSGSYLIDRWNNRISSAGTWTITQEALSADEAYEDGFSKALKWDNTTADASLSAGDYARIHYCIEAQDCQSFKLGNSGSATFTVGFWVKATKTGTNILTLIRTDQDRMCCTAYTISSSNTWEYKVVTFPADTSGGVVNDDTGEGLEIDWHIAAGSSFTSGSLQTTWAARDNTKRAVGQVNHADSTSNNFHITGVQFEVGTYTSSTIPPFQHESYVDNLLRCFRYFYKDNDGTGSEIMSGLLPLDSSHSKRLWVQFKTPMRVAPTQTNDVWSGSGTITAMANQWITTYSAEVYGRDNDDTNAIYYQGSDWSAEL